MAPEAGTPLTLDPNSQPEPDPMHGTPYRLVAPLGSGGMSDVYEVEHRILGRRFVVKLLKTSLQQHKSLVDRMRVEAQALGALKSPHLVDVTDFGHTAGGRPYLVMERLHGVTLGQLVDDRGALPARHAVRLVQQLLAGLQAAHDVGIVHRDVKLENVFLHEPAPGRQIVKVLDFGIAKILEGASEKAPAPLVFPTAEGVVVGTPRFVAPEQAANRPLDHRADIYATGLVLYSLLAGRGPYDDLETEADLMKAHVSVVPPPPSAFTQNEIPTELEQVVAKALAKEPAARFQSAREFARALDPSAGSSSSDALGTTMFDRDELAKSGVPGSRVTELEPARSGPRRPARGGDTEPLGPASTQVRAPDLPPPAIPTVKAQASPAVPTVEPAARSRGSVISRTEAARPAFVLGWIGAGALVAIGLAAYFLFVR